MQRRDSSTIQSICVPKGKVSLIIWLFTDALTMELLPVSKTHGSFTVERELKKKKEERIAYLVTLCTCARQKNRPTETEIT